MAALLFWVGATLLVHLFLSDHSRRGTIYNFCFASIVATCAFSAEIRQLARSCPGARASKAARLTALAIATTLLGSWLSGSHVALVEAAAAAARNSHRGAGHVEDSRPLWYAACTNSSILPRTASDLDEWDDWKWSWTPERRRRDHRAPWVCGACVLDPLVYPDAFCAKMPIVRINGSVVEPSVGELRSLEPYSSVPKSTMLEVITALPGGMRTTIGVLGDSFMQQALDAMACDLRRLGMPRAAGFLDWPLVHAAAGRMDEEARPRRYHWGGPHGQGPQWYVLSQMYYSRSEVAKLLLASDVVLINYGLHYCQPVRPVPDGRCVAKFEQYEAEMHELFASLQQFGSVAGRVAIFQETSTQHFPPVDWLSPAQQAHAGGNATGDWELRSFFPGLGPKPPAQCRCAPTGASDVPLRTRLIRNLTSRYPAVRLLRLHDLLAPRYGWHQQDCKARAQAQQRWLDDGGQTRGEAEGASEGAGEGAGGNRHRSALMAPPPADAGCDCTHYCYSPNFWQVWQRALVDALRGRPRRRRTA